MKNIPIQELKLSSRIIRVLRRNGITNLEELIQVVESGKVRNFRLIGEKSLNDIDRAIEGITSHRGEKPIVQNHNSEEAADVDMYPISVLNLPKSVTSQLIKNRIFSIGDLRRIDPFDLYRFKKISPGAKKEIYNALDSFIHPQNFEEEDPLHFEDVPISRLDLPGEVIDHLSKNGMKSIGDLRRASRNQLFDLKFIGPKTYKDIIVALEKFTFAHKPTAPKGHPTEGTWAELVEPYFRKESEIRSLVLLWRFGLNPKSLEDVASELTISRERVRQLQNLSAKSFYTYVKTRRNKELQYRILELLDRFGDQLTLPILKSGLSENNLLGQFSRPLTIGKNKKVPVDPLETLIIWLSLLSNPKIDPNP